MRIAADLESTIVLVLVVVLAVENEEEDEDETGNLGSIRITSAGRA